MGKRIIGIYLAAGKSRRFGKRKLEQLFMGQPLGSIALKTVLQSDITYTNVICSDEDSLSWIPTTIDQLRPNMWDCVPCQSLEQSHSLKVGLQKAIRLKADAVIVFLADQPFISSALIQKLIDTYSQLEKNEEKNWYISAAIQGDPRPPVLFTQNMFPHLMSLEGDKGARSLIRLNMDKGMLIDFTDPALFLDIDTPKDFTSALQNKP